MPQDTNSKKRIAGIYTIIHTASGRAYVGQTNNWKHREWQHKKDLMAGCHGNDRLQKAWNKYGAEGFKFSMYFIIKGLDNDELRKKLNTEEIRICRTFPDLFNLRVPGDACMTPSKITRRRLSISISRSHARPAFRKKLSIAITKAHERPEYKAAIKAAAKKERSTLSGRARMKRIRIEAHKDPLIRAKHKKATKAAWKDPVAKAKRIASFNTPEGKANRAEAARLAWARRKATKPDDT